MGVEPEGGVAVGTGVLPAAPPPPITIQFSYIRNHITYDVGPFSYASNPISCTRAIFTFQNSRSYYINQCPMALK